MWLDPDSLRRWMCPGDSTLVYVELTPVVGGTFRFDMQASTSKRFTAMEQWSECRVSGCRVPGEPAHLRTIRLRGHHTL